MLALAGLRSGFDAFPDGFVSLAAGNDSVLARLAALPVVIVSAQGDLKARGARKIIRKPLCAKVLLAVVAEFSSP